MWEGRPLLSRSVNFYFIDESEPSLVFERFKRKRIPGRNTKPQLNPHYYKPNHLARIEALGRVYAYLPREKGWVSNKQGKKEPRNPLH